jgi:large subunit ribosomal protein L9
MEVILQKDVDRVGKAFDVVQVKDGYAINFLIPQQLAVIATPGKKQRIERDKKAFERKEGTRVQNAEQLAKKLEELSITITVKVGEADKMYGSVTPQMIAEKIAKEGYNIHKKDIRLEEPIKALGVYNIQAHLHRDVTADLKVWVVKEGKLETDKPETDKPEETPV